MLGNNYHNKFHMIYSILLIHYLSFYSFIHQSRVVSGNILNIYEIIIIIAFVCKNQSLKHEIMLIKVNTLVYYYPPPLSRNSFIFPTFSTFFQFFLDVHASTRKLRRGRGVQGDKRIFYKLRGRILKWRSGRKKLLLGFKYYQ